MSCCNNRTLEEIARTQYAVVPNKSNLFYVDPYTGLDIDPETDLEVMQEVYAQCNVCKDLHYKCIIAPRGTTVYLPYNGPLTPEEIRFNAPYIERRFSAQDLSRIIKER